MGEGLYIGLLVGVLYLAVETFSGQAIKLSLYHALQLGPGELLPAGHFSWDGDRLISISLEDLTRNMTDAALFLWPAVMAITGIWRRPQGRIAAILLFVLTVIVVIASRHAASKLAIVVGISVFALAYASRRWGMRVVMGAWIFACLAVVPLALLANRLDMEDADWLEASARHRIIIWNYTAEMTLDRPIIGVGANMTYLMGPELERRSPLPTSTPLGRTLSIHSHNIYLQTWFELGAVGALLLMTFGLTVIGAIGRLATRVQPYAYATFASAAAMAAVSYGMWQAWFMASFGLTAVLCVLGARCLTSDDGASDPEPRGAG
jgi:O-antigen ligase